MKYEFINHDIDKKMLLKNEESDINQFLLENSTKQVDLIYNFLCNSSRLLLVNGFMGTGKTALVAHTGIALSKDVIVLAYNCFETKYFKSSISTTLLSNVDEDLKQPLYEFIKMRKAIKKPLTTRGLELMIKKLYGITTNINEQIDIKVLQKACNGTQFVIYF